MDQVRFQKAASGKNQIFEWNLERKQLQINLEWKDCSSTKWNDSVSVLDEKIPLTQKAKDIIPYLNERSELYNKCDEDKHMAEAFELQKKDLELFQY